MTTISSLRGMLLGLVVALFTTTSVLAQSDPGLVADLQHVIDKHRAYTKKYVPMQLWKTPPCRVSDALFWYSDGTKKDPGHHFIAICSNIDGAMVVTLQPRQPDDGLNQYYASCYKHYFWTRRNCDVRLNQWSQERKVLQ